MRASQFHLFTLKEAPAEAEIISHQLMMRTGMIRKHAGGIYSYLPLALRIIRKIEAIVREEMNAAGALEVTMPMVQPAELWDESGRWEKFGPELLRFKDRHGRDFLLQPTSEEVITDIVRNEIHSWRQLPKNFYQIQTKFRDERRPRFGIMRGREFTMKDAYSFDRSPEDAHISYQKMYTAYQNIFQRLGLNFRAVQADTGAIGGSLSHEFQVIAETGEDLIVYSTQSDFAANIELAPAPTLGTNRAAASESLQKTATPNSATCQDVANYLQQPLTQTVKSIVFYAEPADEKSKGKLWLCLVRGDHHANEVKIGKLAPFQYGFRLATEAEIVEQFQCAPGYLGPVGISKEIGVIADNTVGLMSDFICGANIKDFHYTGTNWQRDLPEPDFTADIRNIVEGDLAPDGSGPVAIQRGIEVGHVFYLGTRYSEALQAHILDENGKQSVLEMGCYGIGITRIMGAAIEQNHDEKGIIWPKSMAPFAVVLCPIGWNKSEAVQQSTTELYNQLQALGIEVILDDRDLRPGAMFADWELIGVPVRVTIGERGLKEGKLEVQTRANGVVQETSVSDAVACIQGLLAE